MITEEQFKYYQSFLEEAVEVIAEEIEEQESRSDSLLEALLNEDFVGFKEILDSMIEEEIINELSKETLGSYVKKARESRADASDRFSKIISDPKVKKLSDKASKLHRKIKYGHEEEGDIDRLNSVTAKYHYQVNKKGGRQAEATARKRRRGIDKAVNKLQEDSINELSSETLKSYLDKARKREAQHASRAVGNRAAGLDTSTEKELNKAVKRRQGGNKAWDKLLDRGDITN